MMLFWLLQTHLVTFLDAADLFTSLLTYLNLLRCYWFINFTWLIRIPEIYTGPGVDSTWLLACVIWNLVLVAWTSPLKVLKSVTSIIYIMFEEELTSLFILSTTQHQRFLLRELCILILFFFMSYSRFWLHCLFLLNVQWG